MIPTAPEVFKKIENENACFHSYIRRFSKATLYNDSRVSRHPIGTPTRSWYLYKGGMKSCCLTAEFCSSEINGGSKER